MIYDFVVRNNYAMIWIQNFDFGKMKPKFLDLELGIGECGSKNIGEPGIRI